MCKLIITDKQQQAAAVPAAAEILAGGCCYTCCGGSCLGGVVVAVDAVFDVFTGSTLLILHGSCTIPGILMAAFAATF